MPLHTDKDIKFIKKFNNRHVKRSKQSYKKHGLYHKTNKAYKKADYSTIAIHTADCIRILDCPVFGKFRSLPAANKIRKYGYGLYMTEDLLNLLFIREMTVYQDDILWRKDCRRKNEKKPLSEPFKVKIDGKIYNLGSYYMGESEADFQGLAMYLARNKEIFDKASPYYIELPEIIKLIKKYKLHYSTDNFNIKHFSDTRVN